MINKYYNDISIPFNAYLYAINKFKGRFYLGEIYISINSDISLKYSLFLKERFKLGEKSISKDVQNSLDYSNFIIKGRFIKAEKVISTIPLSSYNYAINVIQRRFKLGEKSIFLLDDIDKLFNYCKLCKIRCKKLELMIKYKFNYFQYLKEILRFNHQ